VSCILQQNTIINNNNLVAQYLNSGNKPN